MLASPTVAIGRKCVIGRGSHIIGHWSIELGDEIQTGPYVYITDQNHSYEAIDEPVGWQTPSEAAVKIGSGSWLGANVVILPGTTLGQEHDVAAGAVVRGHVPRPRCARRRAGEGASPLQREREAGWRVPREPRLIRRRPRAARVSPSSTAASTSAGFISMLGSHGDLRGGALSAATAHALDARRGIDRTRRASAARVLWPLRWRSRRPAEPSPTDHRRWRWS